MHFDLVDLGLFVRIAEERNLTRGASRAALSAAAASARLKSLENQLGQRLFYRDSRGLMLTPAGETLLRHARAILRQIEHVKSDLSSEVSTQSGHFRIFANTTAITEVLPKRLAQFLSSRPAVTVDIQERNTKEVVRGILDSAADIGLVAGPVPLAGLESQRFSTDRLVLVTPSDHPLAQHDSIDFAAAFGFPHVGLRESTLQDFLIQTAAEQRQKLEMRVLMGSFEAMCLMIEAGVGIGLLPESAARRLSRDNDLRVIALSNPWAIRERRVVYRELEALPACARAFVRLLLEGTSEGRPSSAAEAMLSAQLEQGSSRMT